MGRERIQVYKGQGKRRCSQALKWRYRMSQPSENRNSEHAVQDVRNKAELQSSQSGHSFSSSENKMSLLLRHLQPFENFR